ncbi:MAG: hypothetical protein IJW76_09655 [Clostridia bacterium]|nr:hypothetical protein [Clostridia bacterium]
MPENRNNVCAGVDFGRDTVYIDTNRILDCCRDKDCFEDVPVYLASPCAEVLQTCVNIRTKSAEIIAANIGLDEIPFSPGFYQINIRMFLKIKFEVCLANGRAEEVCGLCVLDKSVILFGGEGNVSVFRSKAEEGSFCAGILTGKKHTNLPTAVFEVAAPIILGTKVADLMPGMRCGVCPCDIPECVADCFDGCMSYTSNMPRIITVSIGLFSVVRVERPGQYLVTGTEYAVPEKVCPPDCPENPCEMFRRMSFPVNEFYPPSAIGYQPKVQAQGGCGCGKAK